LHGVLSNDGHAKHQDLQIRHPNTQFVAPHCSQINNVASFSPNYKKINGVDELLILECNNKHLKQN
jgi:hypothetical protein